MYFIILGLATWRLSSLLVDEDGPFDIFARLRALLGVRYNKSNDAYSFNQVGTALTCVWCTSIWVAIMLTISYSFYSKETLIVCLPFALSAVAIAIEKGINNG